jgi:hypothetical protein
VLLRQSFEERRARRFVGAVQGRREDVSVEVLQWELPQFQSGNHYKAHREL